MRSLLFLTTISILISLPSCSSQPDETSELTVLTGATIIDGTGNPAIENGAIIVQGDQILQVGKSGELDIPDNAVVKDVSGKWIERSELLEPTCN